MNCEMGHQVEHLRLDQTKDFEDITDLIQFVVQKANAARFEYQRPDEYRYECFEGI